jgi:hypothetical protein
MSHRSFGNAAWSLDDLDADLARRAVAVSYPTGTLEPANDLRHRQAPRPANLPPQAAPGQWGHDRAALALILPGPF